MKGLGVFRRLRRDHWAGLLVASVGVGVLAQASRYDVGTLAHVGPGLVPLVIGALLVGTGVAIALAAPERDEEGGEIHPGLDPRGWGCIVLSVLLFAGLAEVAGLVPAIFACVLAAALGDRTATLRGSLLLAAGLTLFGVAVFSYGLGVQIPLLRGVQG